MSRAVMLALSALTAFVIAGGGAFLAAAAEADGSLSMTGVYVALVTGAVAAAKDVKTYLSEAPK